MSTNIKGFYTNKSSLQEEIVFLNSLQKDIYSFLRKEALDNISREVIENLLSYLFEGDNRTTKETQKYNFRKVKDNRIKKIGDFDFYHYDFKINYFEQNIDKNIPSHIATYHSNNQEASKFLLSQPGISEYNYSNSTDDQLTYLTDKEWEKRKEVWDSVLENRNSSIFQIELADTANILLSIDESDFKSYLEYNHDIFLKCYKNIFLDQVYYNYHEEKYGVKAAQTRPDISVLLSLSSLYDNYYIDKNEKNNFDKEEQKLIKLFEKQKKINENIINIIKSYNIADLSLKNKEELDSIKEKIDLTKKTSKLKIRQKSL